MAIINGPTPAPTQQWTTGSEGPAPSQRSQLAALFGLRDFRRLLTVRLLSQLSDGVFQVSLASYVVFSPERQADPADIASALAVLLLPFSLVGPFTGVLLDRWRRRQVLFLGNLTRCVLVLGTAVLVLNHVPDWLYFGSALLITGINRFILAGLSASLPRVVDGGHLVTANAVSPTLGTVAATVGGASAFLVGLLPAHGAASNALLVLFAALLYLSASLAARRMPPDLLGPQHRPEQPALQAVRETAQGLVEGLRHLVSGCRPAAHALVAMTATRFCYGVLTVTVLMLCRNTFNNPADSAAGLGTLGVAVGVSGAGFFLAAVISPWLTRRLGVAGWLIACTGSAALFVPGLGLFFSLLPTLAAALLLGMITQGAKICTDTIVQSSVGDGYRGRVFAVYDVLFNVAYVAAAALTALVLPLSGRSAAVVLCVAALFGLTAALYARAVRRTPPPLPQGVAATTGPAASHLALRGR